MTGHSLAPLVAKLRERGDAVSIAAADAICGLIVRADEDARWQVRAGHAHERAQRIGEVSDERAVVIARLRGAIHDAVTRLRTVPLAEGCTGTPPCLGLDADNVARIADDLAHATRQMPQGG